MNQSNDPMNLENKPTNFGETSTENNSLLKEDEIKNNAKQKEIDFWVGKVSGSREEIASALDVLKYTPTNAEQLQKEINRQVKQKLGETLREAEEQHQYTPY